MPVEDLHLASPWRDVAFRVRMSGDDIRLRVVTWSVQRSDTIDVALVNFERIDVVRHDGRFALAFPVCMQRHHFARKRKLRRRRMRVQQLGRCVRVGRPAGQNGGRQVRGGRKGFFRVERTVAVHASVHVDDGRMATGSPDVGVVSRVFFARYRVVTTNADHARLRRLRIERRMTLSVKRQCCKCKVCEDTRVKPLQLLNCNYWVDRFWSLISSLRAKGRVAQ